LGANAAVDVTTFDPVTGKTTDTGLTRADEKGNLVIRPSGIDHDWLLILSNLIQ
jgi:hypothetical protein